MNPTVQPHHLATRGASPPQELSQRQEEVLALIAEALSNKQIAHRLGISEATVKAHISKTILLSKSSGNPVCHLAATKKTKTDEII